MHKIRICKKLEQHFIDFVHVMVNGRIVESGTKELALKLEAEGYDWANEPEAEAVGA